MCGAWRPDPGEGKEVRRRSAFLGRQPRPSPSGLSLAGKSSQASAATPGARRTDGQRRKYEDLRGRIPDTAEGTQGTHGEAAAQHLEDRHDLSCHAPGHRGQRGWITSDK